jgi:hypothetical protein
VIALSLKTMRGSAWLVMSFKHQHIPTRFGTEPRTAEPSNATSNHEDIDAVLHQSLCGGIIIVVASSD